MRRKLFSKTLGQAVFCSIVFALVIHGMTDLPHVGGVSWWLIKLVLFIFLGFLNIVMLIGFTSLQNHSTKVFYAIVIPIYPLYIVGAVLIREWVWWQYVLIFITYSVFFSFLTICFTNRTFTRLVESVVIVLFIFSIPSFYSAIL